LQVSFKLQLILGLLEWVLTLYTSVAVHAVYSSSVESSTTFSFWHHFWSSLLLVYILPCCIVYSSQQQQQQQQTRQQQTRQQKVNRNNTMLSSGNRVSASSSTSSISQKAQPTAGDANIGKMRQHLGGQPPPAADSSDLWQCPEGSAGGSSFALQAVLSQSPLVQVAAASAVADSSISCPIHHCLATGCRQQLHQPQLEGSARVEAASDHADDDVIGTPRALQQLGLMLQQLLGEEEAAQTLAAVRAARTSADMTPCSYHAVSTCLNVSVKVCAAAAEMRIKP
jgi:hypothetical protein